MALVTVEMRADGWWLVPDRDGRSEVLLGMEDGPYPTEWEAEEAVAVYL